MTTKSGDAAAAPREEGQVIKGKIKAWNVEKGYGFAAMQDGGADLFIHQSSVLVEGGRFRAIAPGTQIEASYSVRPLDGREASSDTTGPSGTPLRGFASRMEAAKMVDAAEASFRPKITDGSFKGKCKWFNSEKGFGFISSENHGDIFVNIKDIIGQRPLDKEEEVTYCVATIQDQNRAVRVSSSQWHSGSDQNQDLAIAEHAENSLNLSERRPAAAISGGPGGIGLVVDYTAPSQPDETSSLSPIRAHQPMAHQMHGLHAAHRDQSSRSASVQPALPHNDELHDQSSDIHSQHSRYSDISESDQSSQSHHLTQDSDFHFQTLAHDLQFPNNHRSPSQLTPPLSGSSSPLKINSPLKIRPDAQNLTLAHSELELSAPSSQEIGGYHWQTQQPDLVQRTFSSKQLHFGSPTSQHLPPQQDHLHLQSQQLHQKTQYLQQPSQLQQQKQRHTFPHRHSHHQHHQQNSMQFQSSSSSQPLTSSHLYQQASPAQFSHLNQIPLPVVVERLQQDLRVSKDYIRSLEAQIVNLKQQQGHSPPLFPSLSKPIESFTYSEVRELLKSIETLKIQAQGMLDKHSNGAPSSNANSISPGDIGTKDSTIHTNRSDHSQINSRSPPPPVRKTFHAESSASHLQPGFSQTPRPNDYAPQTLPRYTNDIHPFSESSQNGQHLTRAGERELWLNHQTF
mmetsp:Transcript_3437/g.6512  ORF Transcript_3437/g.6512 Transcript_3437/m.6512 type:complete len:682 (+) Transcript_3437:26-2071(+)